MHAALSNSSLPYALTVAAGLLMVRIASAMQKVESKHRIRWCASCHRRMSGRSCNCSSKR
jgi:hypothetical protein